jgi:probable F420-dependent oxidoreductase
MTTAPLRPFRFSSPANACRSRGELRERARMLEDLGFSTVTVSDHFGEQLGPIAALVTMAEATSTLRLAPLVLCNDYRHPVVIAKEVATMDLLSEGRLEVGLGAGWRISDYEVSGIPFDPPGVRIDRLGESIHLLKALWSGEPVHHEGRHFRVEGMAGFPLPVQRPHPPLIVGGGGRRVLSLAAREADIVGIIPSLTAGKVDASTGREATPEATDQKLAWIREAAGDRLGDIELQVRLEVALVTDDPDPYFEALSGSFGLTPDQARGCPYALCGPVEAMVDQLVERRERWGLSYVGIPFEAVEAMAPVVAKLAGT